MTTIAKLIGSAACALITAFCCYGFLASFEMPGWSWQATYAGIGSVFAAAGMVTFRSAISSKPI